MIFAGDVARSLAGRALADGRVDRGVRAAYAMRCGGGPGAVRSAGAAGRLPVAARSTVAWIATPHTMRLPGKRAMRPGIVVTMGDPAGIGPELCVRLLRSPIAEKTSPVILGSASVLDAVAERLGMPPVRSSARVLSLSEHDTVPAMLKERREEGPLVIDLGPRADEVQPGVVNARTGRASFEYVEQAIRVALEGIAQAVVTGPIHKEAWHAAGVPFPGHTELFADRTGVENTCMMLTSEAITCSLVTTHIGLADVPGALEAERIRRVIALTGEAMGRLRGRPPRIGVCGLNPHAGEHGLFGRGEEERVIAPAIAAARKAGWQAEGPLPPDSAFTAARREHFDAYVCMYHDQGLIPLKTLAFERAVNVTLGLPIVRTSVDHGPALDIAWQGKADPGSLFAAVKLALRLVG